MYSSSKDEKKEKKRGCAIISHTQSYFDERTQAASHSHKKVDQSEADSSGGLMHREITQEENVVQQVRRVCEQYYLGCGTVHVSLGK